jgi:hypothetical protein
LLLPPYIYTAVTPPRQDSFLPLAEDFFCKKSTKSIKKKHQNTKEKIFLQIDFYRLIADELGSSTAKRFTLWLPLPPNLLPSPNQHHHHQWRAGLLMLPLPGVAALYALQGHH